jgi:uncharacterized membrane protein YvbJ
MSKAQELAKAIELIDNDCTKAATLLRQQEAAMQMALEALEVWAKYFPDNVGSRDEKAITKLKELLK